MRTAQAAARRTYWPARASTATTSARLRLGHSARISSSPTPSARLSNRVATGTRVPRKQGSPPRRSGSETIRSCRSMVRLLGTTAGSGGAGSVSGSGNRRSDAVGDAEHSSSPRRRQLTSDNAMLSEVETLDQENRRLSICMQNNLEECAKALHYNENSLT